MSLQYAAASCARLLAIVSLSVLTASAQDLPPQAQPPLQVPADVRQRVERSGQARVIVELNLPEGRHVPEGPPANAAAVAAERQSIASAGARVLARLPGGSYRIVHRYQTVAYLALEVDLAALVALESAAPDVARVMDDEIARPVLAESVPLVQGDQVWASGYTGAGTTIAVLDTGVDSTHPFLAGKVVEEACFSSTVSGTSLTFCPNGLDEQLGPGSAAPCSLHDCSHGTHVAGIAAGNGGPAGQTFSGVARDAQLMAVQVFSDIIDPASCGGIAPCAGAYASDIIAGLERVYLVAAQRNVVAVNMSLGGTAYSAPCDDQPYKPIIDNLRSIGVATVVASGNAGFSSAISSPACISSAVSVGSTDKNDSVSWFSNVSSFMSLFAPGESIVSSVPGGGYEAFSGTSMAAPHVAGSWALMRSAVPGAGVNTILNALEQTGLLISDTRFFGTASAPRIRVFQALGTLVPLTNPAPSITAVSPARVRAGSGTLSLTITGSGFDAFTVARWNGSNRPTTVLSTTRILASISAADLSTVGAASVSVFTPAPGGGTSTALTVTIDPPATLSVNTTSAAPGSPVTVTLSNGYGGSSDWLALSAAGSANTSYLQWTYVGAGVTDREWTVTMPASAGTYEFRLFLNGGYTRAATSPAVTVDPTLNPVPVVSTISPAIAFVGGAAFTLTVNGSNFVTSSIVRWNGADRPTTPVSSTQLQAAIGAADLAVVGTAAVSVFNPSPGGGTSGTLNFTISPPASIAVSATTVKGGDSLTATLTNGQGGSADWLALALTSAPNNSYVQYTYVGAGVRNRTWVVAAPSTPGTYEFRLFLNGGYTRAATSPAVTVQAAPTPVPGLTSMSPSSTAVGAGTFTLSLTGTGFISSSVVRWNGADRATTFVSSTQLRAVIPASDVAAIGTAQVTVFSPAPGGGVSGALTFTITSAPTLTVSATSVAAGASVTATLTNGFGGSGDWLALAPTTAPNTSYTQFTYVGTGVTTRTWTVTMPSTAGTYEFRLFLNNGYTRVATSPPVTVLQGSNPVPAVSSMSPAAAAVGGAAFTLTVSGSGFVSTSIVRWNGADRVTTFVNSTQLRASIPATDLAAAGTAQVTVFSPAPGGGLSSALAFTIGATPSLAVSTTTAAPGSSVTVTLTNGFGGATDWLALASTAAPDTGYVQYTYVGAGVTTRTWTVTMPATPGTYEFRLFLNNSYNRAATSPTVTVK